VGGVREGGGRSERVKNREGNKTTQIHKEARSYSK
jgi:hypothetical protein